MDVTIKMIPVTIIFLFVLKTVIVGAEFNIFKWIKQGSSYVKKYNDWLSKRP